MSRRPHVAGFRQVFTSGVRVSDVYDQSPRRGLGRSLGIYWDLWVNPSGSPAPGPFQDFKFRKQQVTRRSGDEVF